MKSIRGSLVTMLIAAFVLISFVAALNGYLASMAEAEKLLDSQLNYVSEILLLSSPQTEDRASDGTLPGRPPATDKRTATRDGSFTFQVWDAGVLVMSSPGAPAEPLNLLESGYRYANFSGYRWRTLTVSDGAQRWYIVAERADLRHVLAEQVALESVLPLLLWLPAAAVLIWVLVGWGLRPLSDLSDQINNKRSDDLQPLDYSDPPSELAPVVGSTNSLLARLSAAFDREKHFAAHAAHELRTPLSVLKVHLHNLAEDLPRNHNALMHANAGVERMHNLVEQILDLNRTNPEIIKANFKPLDLHSLAQRVTATAWPAFSERAQVLSLNGDKAHMQGDEDLLETLLQNLLANACKYTPAGGEIRVFAGLHNNIPRLQVEDSGPGIKPENRERVFQRFYRVSDSIQITHTETSSESGPIPGSGLGLAIAQHIAQLHNTQIQLGDSTLGTGLAVTVDFPPPEVNR